MFFVVHCVYWSRPSVCLSLTAFPHYWIDANVTWGNPHLTQHGEGWGRPPCQVASWSIQPFGHNRYGPKIGGSAPFGGGELASHLTQCRLSWGLPPYQVASWSIQPFGYNRYGPKIEGSIPFWGRGAGSPSNTMWPGPTCTPSFILIRPAVWP